ncbi:MAG: hypothetical protein HYR48_01185, partial [Gemmatimonadetes bacterium]|nr:hypothetical protein [Gemmatimonadota bacterium]
MSDLLDLPPREAATALGQWLVARGEPAYRLNQVLPRLWQRPVASWADALELPAPLRRALEVEWPFGRLG